MKLKIQLFLVLLFVTFQGYSQISIGQTRIGGTKDFKEGVLERFKKTETIFMLSSIYDKEEYEKILKDSWDVTPFRVVNYDDFDITDYISGQYSFAQLSGIIRIVTKPSGRKHQTFYTYIDFKMFDDAKLKKGLKKLLSRNLKPHKERQLLNRTLQSSTINIGRVIVYPKDEFIHTVIAKNLNTIGKSLNTEDVLFNYKPGFLKNYFQKVSNLLKNEEIYSIYTSDFLPELKNVANSKLYIPSYISIQYDGWRRIDSKENVEVIEEIFNAYDYAYEILPDEDLSNKIMNNEEFYYLRYVRMNAERFLQVVNSKTGEVIYRQYLIGMAYNLKSKHIRDLNNKIIEAERG